MDKPQAKSYRTKEDEQRESQKRKVRFADISLTAAWIAASYQAFTPEQIRSDIQSEWASKITKEITKDQKFAGLFERRRRNEGRKEYTARRLQQVEIRRAINDLVGTHSDLLFEKSPQVQKQVAKTIEDLAANDYHSLGSTKNELIETISKAQEAIAEPFKKQNDKNNARFGKKKSLLYRRSEKDLLAIQAKEKAETQARIIIRRSGQRTKNQEALLYQKALAKILAKINLKEMNEAMFIAAYQKEINRQLYKKNGHKRYKVKEIDNIITTNIGWQSYRRLTTLPNSALPKVTKVDVKTPTFTKIKSSSPPIPTSQKERKGFLLPNFNFLTQFKNFDFLGLTSILKLGVSLLSISVSKWLGTLGSVLGKIPGLGFFFGSGAVAKRGLYTINKQNTYTIPIIEYWGPILIVGTIILLLVILIIKPVIFDDPTTQPQALIELIEQAITPTLTPPAATP
jgi:hypothetical protein